jgi:nucleotide-binding universal stress UspA family protein
MDYKTIFTPLSNAYNSPPELVFAAAFAEAEDAHLDVLCLGIDRTPNTYFEIGSNAVIMHAAIEAAHGRAETIRKDVEAYLSVQNLRWEAANSVTSSAGVGRTVASNGRFADIAVVAQPYAESNAPEACLVLEGILFATDCPAIIVPAGASKVRPERILIAWNESPEAMRAIRAALPLLKKAGTVHIAIVDPPETGPERSDPGGALAVYLSRHGIKSDIQVMTRQGLTISERLAHHVTETGSDMLVMGGYGHSRFREAVLGGATRDMLENSKVPVLMAH